MDSKQDYDFTTLTEMNLKTFIKMCNSKYTVGTPKVVLSSQKREVPISLSFIRNPNCLKLLSKWLLTTYPAQQFSNNPNTDYIPEQNDYSYLGSQKNNPWTNTPEYVKYFLQIEVAARTCIKK